MKSAKMYFAISLLFFAMSVLSGFTTTCDFMSCNTTYSVLNTSYLFAFVSVSFFWGGVKKSQVSRSLERNRN